MTEHFHTLLNRQIKRHFGAVPEAGSVREFIEAVNKAYLDFDSDRSLIERSMEFSSQELLQANMKLTQNIADRKKAEGDQKATNEVLRKNEKALRNMLVDFKKTNEDLKNTQGQLFQSEKLAKRHQKQIEETGPAACRDNSQTATIRQTRRTIVDCQHHQTEKQ
jgi:hypothetical protein